MLAKIGANNIVLDTQARGAYLSITISPWMDEALAIDVFLYTIFGSMMTTSEYDILTKFLKMKLLLF